MKIPKSMKHLVDISGHVIKWILFIQGVTLGILGTLVLKTRELSEGQTDKIVIVLTISLISVLAASQLDLYQSISKIKKANEENKKDKIEDK